MSVEEELRAAAERILRDGTVGCVVGWGATRFPDRTVPMLARTPEEAQKLVWNGYCVNGLAKYALDDRYPERKIGLCVRGCDSRAVNRMLLDNQLKRENLYLIGLPCEGKRAEKCAHCAHKNPVVYDELVGEPVEEAAVPDRFYRADPLEKLSSRERYEYWSGVFSKCIRCYACRNACPACNCRECYADQYRTGWQGKQMNGAENQIYGMTRAYHVGDRCIECGECERVCPMRLPILSLTQKVLKDINQLHGPYECGMEAEQTNFLGEFDFADKDDFM